MTETNFPSITRETYERRKREWVTRRQAFYRKSRRQNFLEDGILIFKNNNLERDKQDICTSVS